MKGDVKIYCIEVYMKIKLSPSRHFLCEQRDSLLDKIWIVSNTFKWNEECNFGKYGVWLFSSLYIFPLDFSYSIGPAVRVFANGPGDLGSIPGRVIPKTLKMVLDTTLLNTQHYRVQFKGKVEQSWEWSSALPYTLV